MTAKKEAPVKEAGDVFELEGEALTEIANRGRKAKPSRFIPNVEKAHETGKAFGIPIKEGEKATTIVSQLRTAGDQLKLKLRIMDKSQEPKPYIGFKVIGVKENGEAAEAQVDAAE